MKEVEKGACGVGGGGGNGGRDVEQGTRVRDKGDIDRETEE